MLQFSAVFNEKGCKTLAVSSP